MMDSFQINDRSIGPGHPCFIIAEIAQAHDGSLGMAHQHIDVAARAGCDAVKFQTHIADAESTPEEPWRVKFSRQDATRMDYWRRMEFTRDQWVGLRDHAQELGLIFLSSPFSEAAVDLLDELDMPAWKIASGEVENEIMLRRIRRTRKPVLISSGMSHPDETTTAVASFRNEGIPVGLFQCTTAYPCPPESIGLNWIRRYRDQHGVPVGLSDHSGKIYASLAAVALGADMLEVHLALGPDLFGPDVPASLMPQQLQQLCEGVRDIEASMANDVDKAANATSMASLRTTFGKSLHAAQDIPSGKLIDWDDLTAKKPGIGIPVAKANEVVGCTTTRAIRTGDRLTADSIAEPIE